MDFYTRPYPDGHTNANYAAGRYLDPNIHFHTNAYCLLDTHSHGDANNPVGGYIHSARLH